MTAFLMAAVPCRIRLFFASSTVDLASRAGCYTLRAIVRKRLSTLRVLGACFLIEIRAGLSHFHLMPVASLRLITKQGLNLSPSVLKTDALPDELFASASRARPVVA